MSDLVARHYLISGRVQGVGFRYFAERVARPCGVTGWVRNLADGRVEVHANGTPTQLDSFERQLRRGPSHAEIREFLSREDTPTHAAAFEIR